MLIFYQRIINNGDNNGKDKKVLHKRFNRLCDRRFTRQNPMVQEEDYEIDDLISEIADNNIPIYTYDLLQYASNNFDLIEPNDLCLDSARVTETITANIYEVLTEALYEYITKQNEE